MGSTALRSQISQERQTTGFTTRGSGRSYGDQGEDDRPPCPLPPLWEERLLYWIGESLVRSSQRRLTTHSFHHRAKSQQEEQLLTSPVAKQLQDLAATREAQWNQMAQVFWTATCVSAHWKQVLRKLWEEAEDSQPQPKERDDPVQGEEALTAKKGEEEPATVHSASTRARRMSVTDKGRRAAIAVVERIAVARALQKVQQKR